MHQSITHTFDQLFHLTLVPVHLFFLRLFTCNTVMHVIIVLSHLVLSVLLIDTLGSPGRAVVHSKIRAHTQ